MKIGKMTIEMCYKIITQCGLNKCTKMIPMYEK